MADNELFTEEQRDYLLEMLNIGAGNASTALSLLLRCQVNMKLPDLEIVPPAQVALTLGDPALPVACVKMKMIGDLGGDLFFIVPDSAKMKLAAWAEGTLLGPKQKPSDPDQVSSVLAEIGNIVAGVYMTAIHDFCKLNIYHSVPVLAVDMMQSLLDESLAACSSEGQSIIVVKNEFITAEEEMRTFFLIFPSRSSYKALVDSIAQAIKAYGNT